VERASRRVKGRGRERRAEPLEKLLARLLENGDGEALPYATVDHDRQRRTGAPEVVYAAGKTAGQVVGIARRIVRRAGRCLVTRAADETRAALVAAFPEARVNHRARTVFVGQAPAALGRVCVVSAGTSDLPVAEEAVETLLALGSRVERLVDVGVAGLHRILLRSPSVRAANAVIVVAGMEGALPSVVGGLTARPVFAVPTSVGYGASFHGLAALLGMLNSCAPGVAVVNIDNGFGAAFAAHRVNALAARRSGPGARRARRNGA
jgi:pyridinium-3,5-biscarboxylic acid mononucleotide synthase